MELNWNSSTTQTPPRYALCLCVSNEKVIQGLLTWTGTHWVIEHTDNRYPFVVTHWIEVNKLPLPKKPETVDRRFFEAFGGQY